MRVRMDRAGRVILPKTIRDRHGFKSGTDLDLSETPDGVTLKPIRSKPSLIKKGSILVYSGEVPRESDLLKAIDEEREDRIRRVWGLWTGTSTHR